ncbi:hydroxycarboxylic acid receptor 3 [Brienomyrus brachyistius]|uniref:hydroxycarboxylic acid receptor 3 n=1 Tax=Brienomyrus brachyistius TaxID=42636 RepID=UPI0020B42395|nr:hydroxycarboxylic acid receptor 3 [Brienomyrus brachyistius]XP_048858768.1 hydroxycarboxylic acid receptor 3 [Brienomyrus brachyistius]
MVENSSQDCSSSKESLANVLPTFLSIEFLLGLPGNILALWIFCCRLPNPLPNTVFLLNMVMADFLLLAGLPFQIDYFRRHDSWMFPPILCNITLFMMAVNRSASIAFMMTVAVNRYLKIVHPHHRINQITVRQARLISLVEWVVVVSLRLPLLTNELSWPENNVTLCQSFGISTLTMGLMLHYGVHLLEFLLPFLVLLFCSFRIICVLRHRQMDKMKKGQRAIRVVQVIVAIFIFCFMPSFVTGVIGLTLKKDSCMYNLVSTLFRFSITFTYLNSALDPILYCFSSSSFHNALKMSFNRLGLVQFQLNRRGSTISEE